jgi:hypothetical protein
MCVGVLIWLRGRSGSAGPRIAKAQVSGESSTRRFFDLAQLDRKHVGICS